MAGVRRRGGRFEGWFMVAPGVRKFFSGVSGRRETLAMAVQFEDRARMVGLGYCAPSMSPRPIKDLVAEYVARGRSNGGVRGGGWSVRHADAVLECLEGWVERLGLVWTTDLAGCLARVEAEARQMQSRGSTGRTINYCVGILHACCRWAVQRGALSVDPLIGMGRFDSRPRTQRRAMTRSEVNRLFASLDAATDGRVTGWRRRLGYEIALVTGLRAGEIRALRRADLDVERGGLVLRAECTKNRRAGFQPLPASLLRRLVGAAMGGQDAPLAFVPASAATALDRDLKRAGIPKWAEGGKIDFHALRVAYVTFVLEAGAAPKEAQSLCRHSTPALTMNVYGRARDDRLSEIVERVGGAVDAGDVLPRGDVQK